MNHITKRTLRTLLIMCVMLAVAVATAWSHVTVSTRSPAQGANVQRSPATASVTFTREIKSGTIKVTNAKGTQVSVGSGGKDPRNVKRVSTKLKTKLPRGVYTVRWKITAADGHSQSGSYSYRVTKGS